LLIKFDTKVDKVDVSSVIQQTQVLEQMLHQYINNVNLNQSSGFANHGNYNVNNHNNFSNKNLVNNGNSGTDINVFNNGNQTSFPNLNINNMNKRPSLNDLSNVINTINQSKTNLIENRAELNLTNQNLNQDNNNNPSLHLNNNSNFNPSNLPNINPSSTFNSNQ